MDRQEAAFKFSEFRAFFAILKMLSLSPPTVPHANLQLLRHRHRLRHPFHHDRHPQHFHRPRSVESSECSTNNDGTEKARRDT
jgi:hypothetical protein